MKRLLKILFVFVGIIGVLYLFDFHKPILLSIHKVFNPLPKGTMRLNIDYGLDEKLKIDSSKIRALSNGVISSEEKTWMKCRANNLKAKFRIKGDLTDHIRTSKISFKIKSKSELINGLKTFSIQHPNTKNFIHEWLFHEFLKSQGFVALEYNFIEVAINGGNNGIYALEESVTSQLFTRNEMEVCPIVKFDEGPHWEMYKSKDLSKINEADRLKYFYRSEVISIKDKESSNNIEFQKRRRKAIDLLQKFRSGELSANLVFDAKKMSKFLAICEVLDARHALSWRNVRFFLNKSNKLEPIGFDADAGSKSKTTLLEYGLNLNINPSSNSRFIQKLFSDTVLVDYFKKDIAQTRNDYDVFLNENKDLILEKMRIINHEFPRFRFSN